MKILQVSTHDQFGGAEAIMQSLHRGYQEAGLKATLAFGEKHFPESEGIWLDRETHGSWGIKQGIRLSNFVRRQIPPSLKPLYKQTLGIGLSQPVRMLKRMAGLEDFDHPVSRKLLELYQNQEGTLPDRVHFHTLHGDYFDLRWLPELSRQVEVCVTLHDEWFMTGHCGYALDCERWKTGCGFCPYLDSYPAVSQDATALNFKRKQKIYQKSRLKIAAPSKWLLDRFRQSPLSEGMKDLKHIPNGVDLEIFKPRDKRDAREVLGLPQEGMIFLFAARGGRSNRYKDYQTIQDALAGLREKRPQDRLRLVVLGERAEALEGLGFPVQFEEVHRDPARMALFYQASDLYLHAANAENYPTVILEAMACGTPVIATQVGGISEQMTDGKEGILVPPGGAQEMRDAIEFLILNPEKLRGFSEESFRKAILHFDRKSMIKAYLEWYK